MAELDKNGLAIPDRFRRVPKAPRTIPRDANGFPIPGVCREELEATLNPERIFSTGAKRDTKDNKPALELISPIFLNRLGIHLATGAEHYGERNWEAGIPLSVSVASLLRHINQYREGCQTEDHLAAIACNIMFIIHTEEMIKRGILSGDLDDVPYYIGSNNE